MQSYRVKQSGLYPEKGICSHSPSSQWHVCGAGPHSVMGNHLYSWRAVNAMWLINLCKESSRQGKHESILHQEPSKNCESVTLIYCYIMLFLFKPVNLSTWGQIEELTHCNQVKSVCNCF